MAGSSVARRGSVPISCYVGANGSGKSLCMVRDSLPALYAGRRFLSTVQLLDVDGTPHPNCEILWDWRQLMDFRDGVVLLDEVTGVASARDSAKLPAQLANAFMQLRRRGIKVRWTSPAYMRADKMIREVTQMVTVCKGRLPGPPPPDPPGVTADPLAEKWGANRLFKFTSYMAEDIEHVETQQLSGVFSHRGPKPVVKEWWWRGSSNVAADSYHTLGEVSSLNTLTDAGLCIECGGTRARPKCTCPRRSREEMIAEALEHDRHDPVPDMDLVGAPVLRPQAFPELSSASTDVDGLLT